MAYAVLALIQPIDPATGNRVSIYVSSVNDVVNGRLVNGLNSQQWEPAIVQAPSLSISIWNGDFQAAASLGTATLPLNMQVVKATWPNADTYYWETAPVEIYAEQPGTAWPWTRRFKGKVTGYGRKSQVLSVTATVDDKPLQANVLTATYAGTGGIEGDANLKSKLKPLILGWARNVEPVLVDAVNSVYQFCAYGAMEAVTTLYERGSDFGASVGDYADYTALVAATIAPGKWGTCLASGLVRLGAPAYGVITGDVKGYKVSGSTPRLTGAIINAAATIAGVSGSYINTTSLTALDSASPYNCNVVITDQVTFLDLAQQMILPHNWQTAVNLDGTLFASKITLTGSPVMTLDAQGKAFPQVFQSDELDVTVPYWKSIFGANRCWRVHTTEEIAFASTFVDKGQWSSTATYREGNTVTATDGSTWLYINGTASSGNALPTWPTTSNTYWSNLSYPLIYYGNSDNWILNSDLTFDTTFWTGASNFSRTAGSTGDPSAYWHSPAGTNPFVYADEQRKVPLAGAAELFISALIRSNHAASTVIVSLDFYKAGAFFSTVTTSNMTVSAVNTWTLNKTRVTPPAGCDAMIIKIAGTAGSGTATIDVASPRIAISEVSSDITSAISGLADITIDADYTGTPTATLPLTSTYKLIRNGVDVSTLATWGASVASGTISASIGASTGVLSLNTSGGVLTDSIITMTATYEGAVRTFTVRVTKRIGAPPAGSGTSSGSIPGSVTLTSSTMVAVGDELTVTTGAAGQVVLSATYTVGYVDGSTANTYINAQWYEWNGSAYVAIGSSVQSSTQYDFLYGFYGTGACNYTQTGLGIGVTKKYKLYAGTHAASGVSLIPSGSVTATAT